MPQSMNEIKLTPKENSLVLSNNSACVIANNELYCWGRDGNHEPTKYTLPSNVNSWEKITHSNYGTCVIDSVDEVYCFGNNTYGTLGNNNYGNISSENAVRIEIDGEPVKASDVSLMSYHLFILEK